MLAYFVTQDTFQMIYLGTNCPAAKLLLKSVMDFCMQLSGSSKKLLLMHLTL